MGTQEIFLSFANFQSYVRNFFGLFYCDFALGVWHQRVPLMSPTQKIPSKTSRCRQSDLVCSLVKGGFCNYISTCMEYVGFNAGCEFMGNLLPGDEWDNFVYEEVYVDMECWFNMEWWLNIKLIWNMNCVLLVAYIKNVCKGLYTN